MIKSTLINLMAGVSLATMLINPYLYGAVAETSSYTNPGGQGDRSALITVTADFGLSSGTIDNLVDGAKASNSTDGIQWPASPIKSFILDFDPGNTNAVFKEISEFQIFQSSAIDNGNWWFRGSNDLLQWDLLLEDFGFSTGTFTPTKLGGYRYYQFMARSGNQNASVWTYEIEFKIRNVAKTIFDTSTASYDFKGGRGVRTNGVEIAMDTSLSTAASGGSLDHIIGGHMIASTSDPNAGWRIASNQTTGKFIRWDFGSAVIMTEWRWNQGSALDHHTWQLQGSNDNSGWTNVGSTFSFSGGGIGSFTTQTEASANTTAYRWYRIIGTSGNTSISLGMFGQFEFKLHT